MDRDKIEGFQAEVEDIVANIDFSGSSLGSDNDIVYYYQPYNDSVESIQHGVFKEYEYGDTYKPFSTKREAEEYGRFFFMVEKAVRMVLEDKLEKLIDNFAHIDEIDLTNEGYTCHDNQKNNKEINRKWFLGREWF